MVQVLQESQQRQLEDMRRAILTELHIQNMELLGALLCGAKLGGIDYQTDEKSENQPLESANMSLPDKEETIPVGLSGVLDFIA